MILKILVALVVAYLGWRLWHGFGRPKAGTPKPPLERIAIDSAAEARSVLGVGADADAGAIRAAHRRLLAAVHPDKGGSVELAARVNRARDVLIGRDPRGE